MYQRLLRKIHHCKQTEDTSVNDIDSCLSSKHVGLQHPTAKPNTLYVFYLFTVSEQVTNVEYSWSMACLTSRTVSCGRHKQVFSGSK